MSEKGDKLRDLADLTDQTEELETELTDDAKLAWLASPPISDEYEIANNLAKEFKVSLTEAKKSLNMLPKKYTISGEDIPTLIKQLRNKRRDLKGQNKIDFTKSIETLIDAYANHLDSCMKSIYWVAPYQKPLQGMTLKESHIRKLDEIKDYDSRSELIDHLCKYWEADIDSRNLPYNQEFAKLQKQMKESKKQFKALLKSVQLGFSP